MCAPGMKVLDIAGGTGDLASAFAERAGATGEVWLTDINASMLAEGRDRLLDRGQMIPLAQCDAERLPFASGYFDVLSVAFGLRNMTHKDAALAEMQRVLKPGGRLLVLEFSRVWQPIAPIYDAYSFNVLPWLGEKIANGCRKLSLSRRIGARASAARRIGQNDGTCRVRQRPMVQSHRRRMRTARRHEVLSSGGHMKHCSQRRVWPH